MKRINFNSHSCASCKQCEFACAAAHCEEFNPYNTKNNSITSISRIKIQLHKNILKSKLCLQCKTKNCLKVCEHNAIVENEEGIVVINDEKCTGCMKCAKACPVKAIFKNPVSNKPVKCDLCTDKIEKNEMPPCVTSCPTKALTYGEQVSVLVLKKAKNIKQSLLPKDFTNQGFKSRDFLVVIYESIMNEL